MRTVIETFWKSTNMATQKFIGLTSGDVKIRFFSKSVV